jgi:Protein of unknown function (DUF4019)
VSQTGLIATALFLAAPALLSGAQSAPTSARHVINVTTDSEAGWLPSEELEAEAHSTLQNYFHALDKGDHRTLWDLESVGLKGLTTFAEFQTGNQKVRKDFGRLTRLDVLQVTWTKDPADAPTPGIYVAIDISGQFTKTKRQCGYVVLFKSRPNDPFRLARIENNYLTDAMARQIAKEKAPAEVDRLWSVLSGHCPNYKNSIISAK